MKFYFLSTALAVMTLFATTACKSTKQLDTAELPTTKMYKLSGSEPFWNIEVTDGGITFTQMGKDAVYFPAVAAKAGGSNRIYETSTTVDGKMMEMRIIMENKPCSDSMADKEYTYKATVSVNGKTYRGCGEEVTM